MITVENDWLKVDIDSHGAEVRKVKHKKNGLNTGEECLQYCFR
jgi:hypothetical protein